MAAPLAALARSGPARTALGVAAAVLLAHLALDERTLALRHWSGTRTVSDEANVPSPTLARAGSLGHREWAADLLWLQALLYYGETVVAHSTQRHLQRYADVIEQVDPRFRGAYLWAATVSIYNSRRITREAVEHSVRHLEAGLRAYPDDPELLSTLGFNYYFEMMPFAETEQARAHFRRRGAVLLQRAAAQGYGPPWFGLAAVNALAEAGLQDQAVDQLRAMLVRVDEPAVRERIELQIEALLGSAASDDPHLRELRRLDAERRERFAYVPPMLYLFVGPPLEGVAPPPARR